MKNFLVRFTLALSLLMVLALSAQAQPTAKPGEPRLQKISEHVYAYLDTHDASPTCAFGANNSVVVGSEAVMVIDTQISAKTGELLLENIRQVTDKPVRYVVNTHYHLDHAWGNCVFADRGAVIIAQSKSLELMKKSRIENAVSFGVNLDDLKGTTLVPASVTFPDRLEVDLGDVSVRLEYSGHTHTADSIIAYVDQDRLAIAGDLLFTGYHPFLAEGDIANWVGVLNQQAEKYPDMKFVPGHGPVSTKKDLLEMAEYLAKYDQLAKKLCQGKTAADAPEIAKRMMRELPDHGRKELPGMVQANLQFRYLPAAPMSVEPQK